MREEEGFELWRRCEDAWAEWLGPRAGAVMRLTDATSNTAHSGAPLMKVGDRLRRAPDLQTVTEGRAEYWEVKTRSRADVDPHTGQHRHWMPYAAFDDYLTVREHTATPTWIVLYETSTATSPGRWLRIDVDRLHEVGTVEHRWTAQGHHVQAWIWPVAAMEVVDGPNVPETAGEVELAPSEDTERPPVPAQDLEPVERDLRRRRRPVQDAAPSLGDPPGSPSGVAPARLHEWLEGEPVLGLDVLRRRLGIPTLPRYSVLRVGLDGVEVDDLLGLLQYGVRVFLISSAEPVLSMDEQELAAFKGSRLLEAAVVPSASDCSTWIVDGSLPMAPPPQLAQAIKDADDSGQFNLSQYKVVHAPSDADVVVEAGAGTGKTDSMSERIVFLLATGGSTGTDAGARPRDLRADEIALVTFTREAAAEMRERVGRSLLVRQRLCRRCAQPVLAWLLQLANADISTIHSLARRIAASSAGLLGLGPDFRVSRLTMDFRSAVQRLVSDDLTTLVSRFPGRVPAAHEWQRHLTTLWEALENNGVDLMRLATGGEQPVALDWGGQPGTGLESSVSSVTQKVVEALASDMRHICLQQQVLPTNQLVPSATAALTAQDDPPVRGYRHLFVDEFQDTDPAQMELFLELRARLDLRLFVVGDVKQGIYRFRGAAGNAFEELARRARERGFPDMSRCLLTRNFRTGKTLLDSFHHDFAMWGRSGWLPYDEAARLRPMVQTRDRSRARTTQDVRRSQEPETAAAVVDSWWTRFPRESVGILCRQNWQALKVQEAVRRLRHDQPIPCEILVGGSFYQTPAVRELRAFLEAVADPHDDASLLELCETRWGAALAHGAPPAGVAPHAWGDVLEPPTDWASRLAPICGVGSVRRDDLGRLRGRVVLLGSMLNTLPLLTWLVECDRTLTPARYLLPGPDDETERQRYGRCLDHLVTLLDAQFQAGPLSLERLLAWVRLQIATNRTEDEPDTSPEGKVVALTVHKAKGLEFDRVVVPWTSTPFGPPRSVSTRSAVRGGIDETPRLLWRWHLHRGKPYETDFTNVPLGRRDEWREDDADTLREETRLLYVAMTRAREELILLTDPRMKPQGTQPTNWQALLHEGRQ